MDCEKKIARVLLVGAGQFGSRHLQSLPRYPYIVAERGETQAAASRLHVDVLDPNPLSRELAETRFQEASLGGDRVTMTAIAAAEDLADQYDVVIVATTSAHRCKAIQTVLAVTHTRQMVLDKFLFQSAEEYDQIGRLLDERKIAAWVNTTRRLYPAYQSIAREIAGARTTMSLTGENWHLACNAVHFLDLFAMLCGRSDLSLEQAELAETPLESNRPGYIEFTGSMHYVTSHGDSLELDCRTSEGGTTRHLEIEAGGRTWQIDETSDLASCRQPSGESQTLPFERTPQSQLTVAVVVDLLQTGRCDLTPYRESAALHLALLRPLQQHYEQIQGVESAICPIT